MQRFIRMGIAAGAVALAPAAWGQTLDAEQATLRALGEAHEAACSASTVSADGQRRCREAKSRLMDLRARVAIINTAIMIADMEGRSAPDPADVSALRQDVQAYASLQPVALEDLAREAEEPAEGEEGEDGSG
ncbi:MAG: hypothetical protein MI723_06360 [Caulobacterales bacterium]|nr:hypothetical protein [Caulobacterales bacterium]